MNKRDQYDENGKLGTNSNNKIGKIIGVLSGKGGVGKSTVAANLAMALARTGYKVGILDADITGPSIPRILNAENQKAIMYPHGLEAVAIDTNLKAISLNFMIDQEDKPVIWRGPIITNTVKQFYQDIIWEELDYLVIDMPPGTGDVALTIMQSFPLDGLVMVTVPQDMVHMIVAKALHMARRLEIEVLGLVENMSYIQCPHCNEKISIFETAEKEEFLKQQDLEQLASLPININYTRRDLLSPSEQEEFDRLAGKIVAKLKSRTK